MASRIDNLANIPDVEIPHVNVHYSEFDHNRSIRSYLENIAAQKRSPYSAEINDFFVLVKNAITSRENSESVPADRRLLFLEEDTPQENEIDTEAITFLLKTRVPGRFDQGPAGVGRIKEVSGHHRAIIDHPDYPGEKLVTMGRFYDNWITFYVYARNAKTSRKRLLWFENLMDGFSWYFRLNGFRVVEEGIGNREIVTIGELTLTRYPMSYMIRTDDTYYISTQELKSVSIDIGVSRQ